METGFRPNAMGQLIPRNIIKEFVCTYNGVEVFRAEFFPAVSANPFVAFTTVATESGTITMTWTGDNGLSRHRVGRHHRRMTGSQVRSARMKSPSSPTVPGRIARAVAALAIVGATFPAVAEIPTSERKSGYDFMAPETRAMQDDDTANAGMLWVLDGEALWNRQTGAAGKSCADCHGDATHQHEGRRCTLSGVQSGARPPGQYRAAHQSMPRGPPAGEAVCV